MDRYCVSYSGLVLYDQCPSAWNRKYILKEETVEGDGPPSEAAARGTRIHKGVELFLRGNEDDLPPEALGFELLFHEIRDKYDPRPEQHFAFNEQWEAVSFQDTANAQVRGILDILYVKGDVCHVIELKTGNMYQEHVDQRGLYGLAGGLLHPECDTIHVDTVYLDGGLVEPTILMQDQVATQKYIWQRRLNKCQPPQKYRQKKSWKCRFCPYHEEKGGTCNGEST